MNTFAVRTDSADIYFENNDESGQYDIKYKHYGVFHRVMNFMKTRGFTAEQDKTVKKTIRKDYYSGQKSDLKFKAHKYPAGFEIQFYQDIIFDNPNGGYYDYNKCFKMPYMIKLLYLNESKHIVKFLQSLGYTNKTKPEYDYAEDKIKELYVESWHKEQKDMKFSLSDTYGFTPEESYNSLDRDKKQLFNGQVKYFRDYWNGRLYRGTIYHNINNMWWIIINKYQYDNIANFELFDLTDDDLKVRRLVKAKTPKEYLIKRESISKSKNKELINELKRRGYKYLFRYQCKK